MERDNIQIVVVDEYSDEVAEALRNLVRQLDSGFQPLTDADVQEMIADSDTTLFLARLTQTGQIVGMVTLIIYRIPYKKKGWLEDVVVDEAFRGQGIAQKLLNEAIIKAKDTGVKSLNLTSNPKREAGNKLYLKMGFEKRDTNVYRMTFE